MSGGDELRELWCSQPFSKTRGEDMLEFVQSRTSGFDRMISVRNWAESVAAGIVVVMFSFFLLRANNPLQRTGCLIIAASAGSIIFYMLRYGKGPRRVDPSLTIEEYTKALVNRYDYQIRFLKSVKYWYLLPPYLGLLLGTLGVFQEKTRTGVLSWIDFVWPAIYTAFFGVVWWLNESYSVRRLRKERAKLLSITSESGSVTD